MSKSKKRIHGDRNFELCKELRKGNLYHDWVVTTAFYSSIHIIEDFLLPITINGETCNNILKVKKAYKTQGRHPARSKLIQMNAFEIAMLYKWLDDQSRYSRYTTYQVTPGVADKAIDYLKKIVSHCEV